MKHWNHWQCSRPGLVRENRTTVKQTSLNFRIGRACANSCGQMRGVEFKKDKYGLYSSIVTRSNAMHYWRAGATQQSRNAMMV